MSDSSSATPREGLLADLELIGKFLPHETDNAESENGLAWRQLDDAYTRVATALELLQSETREPNLKPWKNCPWQECVSAAACKHPVDCAEHQYKMIPSNVMTSRGDERDDYPGLRSDARLGQECEMLIALKTHFTGEPPYVGNDGVLLALREALDELNRLKGIPFSDQPKPAEGTTPSSGDPLTYEGISEDLDSIEAYLPPDKRELVGEVRRSIRRLLKDAIAVSATTRQPKLPSMPAEIQEWCWHLDLHLTEHDDRHRLMAYKAAWPHVAKWLRENVGPRQEAGTPFSPSDRTKA